VTHGSIQMVQQPSILTGAEWLTDVVGLFIPIIPDVVGLLINFGQASEYSP